MTDWTGCPNRLPPAGRDWAWLGPGRAQPAGDNGGAGQAGLREQGADTFQLRLIQAIGEPRQVAKAIAGLDHWRRVATNPHLGVGGEGPVAAQQLQLLGPAEVQADQAAGPGPLVPRRPPLSVGGQLPELRSCRLGGGWPL